VDPREARVGDRVTLTVDVIADGGVTLLPLSTATAFGPFELVSVATAAATSTERRLFTLTTFEVGVATIPPVAVSYRLADGPVQSLRTAEIPVTIRSVLPPQATDIKGLKAPLPQRRWPWVALGIGLGAAFLAAGVWIVRRRRRAARTSPDAPPALPAGDEALAALTALEAGMDGPAKPFYSRLSEIFRRYLLRRYDIPAPDLTTAEILPLIRRREDWAPEQRMNARDILETSDLAKFAKIEPAPEDRRRHWDALVRFVRETTPTDPRP
jgi:hypothetical protein